MGYKKYTDVQEKQIALEYIDGATADQLAEKYGFSTRKSVTDKVKKYFPDQWEEIKNNKRIKKKGYDYKLEKISNEFDAYFLGLLLTDGYVSREKAVGIDLVDEDCIAFLSKSIGREYQSYKSNMSNEKIRYRLLLTDKQLVKNLERLGVVPNKTAILEGPQLLPEEEQYIPYIIRGIIDGDGTIGIAGGSTGASVGMRITSKSEKFANWLKEILEQRLFFKEVMIHQDHSDCYVVESYRKDNMLKLIALCYDKPFGMIRKYEKLRKTFNDYNKDFLLS